ncbi:MAG: glycosyltransferase family 9 protein, partial [Chthoniobacteraceae bacterium]
MKTCQLTFRHGAGDTVNFALQLALYRRRGWEIEVQCNRDKAFILEAAGVRVDTAGQGAPEVAWVHAPAAKAGEMPRLSVLNKAAFNLGRSPLPELQEDREALWREYLEVKIEPQIPAEAWRETEEFLRGLPAPVVLLHTVGNSFQAAKSLDRAVTLDLCRGLLDGMDGSLVLLDWDNRMPRVASHRVRHLTDDWKRIDLARLLALLHRSDLLVGIDSGPMHCARLTGTPGLAVFPKAHHAPHSYLLPRPGLAMVTPRLEPGHPSRHWRHSLQIIEERAEEVGGAFLARQALRMLGGPRYLAAEQVGADVQLQYFTGELERGGGGNFLTEYVDRHRGFDVLLRELRRRAPQARVIETGCVRQEEDWSGAGMGTVLLGAALSHGGGSLVSVDI